MNEQRLARLQAILKERGVDCLALIPGVNLRYMTGLEFHLMERATLALFPKEGRPVFVVPTLERLKVEQGAPFKDFGLFTYDDGDDPGGAVRRAMMGLPEIQTFAVEFLNMRVHELKLTQRHAPTAFLENADPIMSALWMVKSGDEVEQMRAAIEISEKALDRILPEIRPGMTEAQVAAMLNMAQIELGGGPVPFEAVVLAGANSANPHGSPGQRPIQPGEVLLFDFGTTHAGYCSDITRSFVVGEPTAKVREVYEVVRQANEAGRKTARPGVPANEVDRAARKVIVEAGYGDYFTHRVGHGLGMAGHEGPYLSRDNDQLLEAGNIVTIEPGIYLAGEFGIRIEDDVLITPDGADSLTTFPRELRQIGS